MARKKALLVGINKYPKQPLRGCVNDVFNMRDTLHSLYDLDEVKELVILTDDDATKANIADGLRWLADGSAADERIFHFSGHGAQLPSGPSRFEPDGLDECLCPVDFAWTRETAIIDDDLKQLVASSGATLIVDACHSGGMARRMRQDSRIKCLEATTGLAVKMDALMRRGAPRRKLARLTADELGARARGRDAAGAPRYFLACQEQQTASDAWIVDRDQGAFTHYLTKTLREDSAAIDTDLVRTVGQRLSADGFYQQPMLEGGRSQALLSPSRNLQKDVLPGNGTPVEGWGYRLVFNREPGIPGAAIFDLRAANNITWWKSLSVFRQVSGSGSREEIQRVETKDDHRQADCSVWTPTDEHDEYTIELWKGGFLGVPAFIKKYSIRPNEEQGQRLIFTWERD